MTDYRIYSRRDWGAQRGSGWGLRPLPATVNVLHHPAMPAPGADATLEEDIAYVRSVEEVGYSRFRDADFDANGKDEWPGEPGAGISYTWIVTKAGRIFEGHDVARQSSHTSGYNFAGVGIAWAGNFVNGDMPTIPQVNATVWLLKHAKSKGWVSEARIHFGHQDVYPTECPADAYPYIALVNELIETGGTMARRRPTAADMRNLEKELRERGFQIYCGPSMLSTCRAYHKHSSDSRHYAGMAIDVGFDPRPSVPVSDYERAHIDLLMRELNSHPTIDFRMLWREVSGAHHDHGHIDDSLWYETINYANIPDGAVLISPKAFPNHKPKGNDGFTLSYIVEVQSLLTSAGFYKGAIDGYLGPQTRAAVKAFQKANGLKDDGLPGSKTLTALKGVGSIKDLNAGFSQSYIKEIQTFLKTLGYYHDDLDGIRGPATQAAIRKFQKDKGLTVDGLPGKNTRAALIAAVEALKPKPAPAPTPAPSKPKVTKIERVSGADRVATAVAVSKICWPDGAEVVYIAATGTDDIAVGASASREGPILLHPANKSKCDPKMLAEVKRLKPKRVVILGGTAVIPESVRAEIESALP